ncbi:MAG: response regulator transcription factor [Betaproteobacteria bacterium]|jgi:RNA polymerase sigma factor (sigma-70 family)|nr:MAG: response regulator transcription factor [Betaproteobacteria bacterium]TMH30533.1 MAG: response regulator transcription factor [Betaproteobacteria bacterium]
MPLCNIVAVVDDNAAIRDLVRLMLEDLKIEVRTYPSARAFLDDPNNRQTGCLVLDVRMPGMSGPELQQTLHDMQWSLPILFLTAHGDIPMAVEAMRSGAVDFLQKPFQEQQLIDRVQRSLERSRSQREAERRNETLRARFEVLTPREREVLDMLVAGQQTKQIAQRLNISVKTVEEYRATLKRKTHASSMLELVSLATQAGAVSGGH